MVSVTVVLRDAYLVRRFKREAPVMQELREGSRAKILTRLSAGPKPKRGGWPFGRRLGQGDIVALLADGRHFLYISLSTCLGEMRHIDRNFYPQKQ